LVDAGCKARIAGACRQHAAEYALDGESAEAQRFPAVSRHQSSKRASTHSRRKANAAIQFERPAAEYGPSGESAAHTLCAARRKRSPEHAST
jgi:hypothetical protein